MMEAKWKVTRILGLTCCLAFLTAVSMAQMDGAALQTRTAVVKVQSADGTLIADAVVTYLGTGGEQLIATPQGDGTYLIPNAAQKLSLHIEHPSMRPADLDATLTGLNSTIVVNVRGSVVDSKVLAPPASGGPSLGLATLGTAGAGDAQRSASAKLDSDKGPAQWSNIAPAPGAHGGKKAGGACPASSCDAGTISHSQSLEIVGGTGVACQSGGLTTPNAYARCFNLADEGFAGDVLITSVDFGFETEPGFDVPVFANIYEANGNPCPATGYGPGDVILLGTAETVAGPGSAGTLLNAEFAVPVEIAAGSTIIIEFEQLDDGVAGGFALFPGANSLGECGDGSIRAAACGLAGWVTYTQINFPNVHLAMQAHGSSEECGGGGGDGDECEDCIVVGEGNFSGTTADNTGSTGDDTSCTFNDEIDEWYCYTACSDGMATASLCGSSYDTALAVFDGCGGAQLACNDDACGLQSQVSWAVTAGQTYNVRVSGFNNSTGAYTLDISLAGCPVDDIGACCIEGECVDGVTEEECAAEGGEFQGVGSECGGGGGEGQVHVSNPNAAIPDNDPAGVSDTITVDGDAMIEDLDIDLAITHTWVGDLEVTVEHNGTTVALIIQPGDASDTPGSPFGCSENNYDIILDDQGTGGAIEDQCAANLSSPPNYTPNGALADFNGMIKAGDWTITVVDTAGADTGTLNTWSLHINGGGGGGIDCGPVGDCGDGVCDDGGGGATPGAGDCCQANGTPGCDCQECEDCICACDPFCCDVEWDGLCAGDGKGDSQCGASNPNGPCADACSECQGGPACGGGGGGGENCENCPQDCGVCNVCGDGEIGDDEECDGGLCEDGQACNEDCTCPACEVECPPGGIDEAEACGDDTNGGCNQPPGDPPVFFEAECNTSYCGTVWAEGAMRDTDWYRVVVAGGVISSTVISQSQTTNFIVGGIAACAPVVLGDIGCSDECVPLADASADVGPGEFVVFVATGECNGAGIFDGLPCGGGNDYVVEIACEAGGCEDDEDCDEGFICENGVCVPPPPENDDCADALPNFCGDTEFSTIDATTDGPAHPECQFDGQTYNDIWYEFIAPTGGNLTVSTCDLVDYDSDLVVYDGCDCGNLNLLGCNDDGPGCAGFSSEVTVPVTGGNCYLVRVGGWQDGNVGTGILRLSGPPCEIPVGACCFGADCVENLTDEDCTAQGGEWQGEGSACNEAGETFVVESSPNIPIVSEGPPAVDTITMGMDFQLQDVDIDLVINHTWIGDLFITIEHAGTTVVLWDAACGNTDNINVIFDDEGGEVICASPVSGNITPASAFGGALSAFDGDSSVGDWTISVSDPIAFDDGTLVSWSIHLTEAGDSICGCGGPEDCGDGDPCTEDVCGEDGECSNPPVDCGDLDDDCNVGVCVDGTCVAEPANEGGACGSSSDTDCDNPDSCSGGVCQQNYEDAGTGCDDDGNECTDDECDGSGNCTHPNNTDPCDDDNECTTEDTCSDGACEGGPPLDCDDNDGCTADSCDPATGCVNEDIEQTLIIKQGACPNPVNPNSNGVVEMLLVGDAGFDVNDIALNTLALRRCDGVGGAATPLEEHTKVKDLNHPSDSVACGGCACNANQSSDGVDDLSLKFRTSTTLAALLLEVGDGVVGLELTGVLNDGTPFCSRDCVIIVPPGAGTSNMSMEATVFDTFIEVEPWDLNVDGDGFSNFSRAYIEGTAVTINAPMLANGRRFLRWSVDGVLQPFGLRTIEVTATAEDIALMATYVRPNRLEDDRPQADDGDLD